MTYDNTRLIDLIETNSQYDYKLYGTNFPKKNLIQLKVESNIWHEKYLNTFGQYNESSTWGYRMYNLFQLTSGSALYFNIYKTIRQAVFDYLQDKQNCDNVWIGSWINYHAYDNVSELKWHTHEADYHGYLCIDPKDSITNFKDYAIKNQPGLLYIGLGSRAHEVLINEPFSGHRITIAFNLKCSKNGVSRDVNLSHIPLL